MRRAKPAGRAAESVKKTAKTGGDCLLLFFRLFYWGGGMLECLRRSKSEGGGWLSYTCTLLAFG